MFIQQVNRIGHIKTLSQLFCHSFGFLFRVAKWLLQPKPSHPSRSSQTEKKGYGFFLYVS